jgi:hypothetical protein
MLLGKNRKRSSRGGGDENRAAIQLETQIQDLQHITK